MSGLALSSTASLPFFHLGSIDTGVVPIQSFGILVALGVLIGAALLRRYAEWHGISDEHIRGLLAWVTVSGFIGAHLFDVFFYQWEKMDEPWHLWPPKAITIPAPYHGGQETVDGWIWLPLRLWDGISSYGGFVGGAIGFAAYVWWKKLSPRLFADITIVGLLPAFSIGRIGCTVVSDHIGAAVNPSAWYSWLAMSYPTKGEDATFPPVNALAITHKDWIVDNHLLCWNLGLVELLYLIPVNLLVLYLAFNTKKRLNAGLVVVLTGILYAPVRFFLDFLRPEDSDPRHAGLTFAQWISIVAFGVAVYVAYLVFKNGKPAEIVAPSSGEAQARLKLILKEADAEVDDEEDEKSSSKKKPAAKSGAKTGAKKDDKKSKKDKDEPEEEELPDDPTGISFVNGVAAKDYAVPRAIVDAVAKALEGDEHVRAAYYMPIRRKGEVKLAVGLDIDEGGDWKKLAENIDGKPLVVHLDSTQLLALARQFDRKIYPKESDAGAAAAKADKPDAKPFKTTDETVVKSKTPLQIAND